VRRSHASSYSGSSADGNNYYGAIGWPRSGGALASCACGCGARFINRANSGQ